MGRTAKYTDRDILDTALELVAEGGGQAASVVAIAQRLGAPSGSIYHRFASRDLILATLWIRTVQQFQRGFLDALADEDCSAAARAAVAHTLDWTAGHRSEATVLALYRREDLIALWPEELGVDLATINDDVTRAVRKFTTAHFGVASAETLGKAQFALIEIPYAGARSILRGQRASTWLKDAVITAALAVLAADTH